MAGVLGFYAFDEVWQASRFIAFGLRGLQHRGQESAGITTVENRFYSAKHRGFAEDSFNDEMLKGLKGSVGIGHVSPEKKEVIQPLAGKKISFCYDGRFILDSEILKKYGNDEAKAVMEMLIRELDRSDPEQAAASVIEQVDGGYTFVALTKDRRMIVGRDPRGIKSLSIGGLGFDWGIVASESCACDVTGADYSRNISPGEVLTFNPLSIKSKKKPKGRTAYCAYEYVYLARPDSIVNDIPIIRVRKNIGKMLARENPVDGDIVTGVPDTAIPFAMAYSNELGIPVEMGFMRTGRAVRTAIKPTQFERTVGVQLKLNPIRDVIQGKRVVLIDDSVVRGTTVRNTVSLMRRRGVKEVHVRIGSPHIVRHCPYGVEVPPEDELIGRQLSEEEIARAVKADSFAYLSMKGMEKAIGLSHTRLCTRCFADKARGKHK